MDRSNNRSILREPLSALNTSDRGAYVLVLRLAEPATVTVGKLGAVSFDAGAYAYVGSALGSAGFQRIQRHARVFAGNHKMRKWHIDYLSTIATLHCVYTITTDKRIECGIAHHLRANPTLNVTEGFGSSDCRCASHLFYFTDINYLQKELKGVMCSFKGHTTCLEL